MINKLLAPLNRIIIITLGTQLMRMPSEIHIKSRNRSMPSMCSDDVDEAGIFDEKTIHGRCGRWTVQPV